MRGCVLGYAQVTNALKEARTMARLDFYDPSGGIEAAQLHASAAANEL